MSSSRISSYISIILVLVASIVTGALVAKFSKIHVLFISSTFGGKPLPTFSQTTLPHFTSTQPLLFGIFGGLFLAIVLTIIERSPRLRVYFPIGLSVAWVSCFFYAVAAATAATLPYIQIVNSISH